MNHKLESTRTGNHAGRDLVRELAQRRILGSYFSFQGYVRLRRIETPDELRDFLNQQGYAHAPVEQRAATVANYLAALELRKGHKALTAWVVLESLLWVFGLLSL
jgi:hypothetical protein